MSHCASPNLKSQVTKRTNTVRYKSIAYIKNSTHKILRNLSIYRHFRKVAMAISVDFREVCAQCTLQLPPAK